MDSIVKSSTNSLNLGLPFNIEKKQQLKLKLHIINNKEVDKKKIGRRYIYTELFTIIGNNYDYR